MRDPGVREAETVAALRGQVAHAKAKAPAFAKLLAGVEPSAIIDRAAFARLPVLRKADLTEMQRRDPPLGGLATGPAAGYALLISSPGPIYEPEADRANYWRMARALYAAGFRRGDIVHNSFSYHLSPGAWIMQSGARALGCAVIPAGVGNTEQQVNVIGHLRPTAYAGVPDFLKVLLDKAKELAVDVSSIKKAMVSGAALPASLRAELQGRGIDVHQCYAIGDLGLIAYESSAKDGLIVDEDIFVEIVRPGTGDPVPPGEVGEVVVTPLNPDYPLIRFATGDLSMLLPGASPCGRTNVRLKGWMGRADQSTKVKGLFVTPGQVAEVLRRHPAVLRGRLVVSRADEQDVMVLRCETNGGDAALAREVAETLKSVSKVGGNVEFVPADSLPNDGKVIDDTRPVG
ncbi:MAG: AMP-binding protein [Alphaproteobacteria bacterium]|nr:AMP-binding protein [Alphaproteobacteria bacterium]